MLYTDERVNQPRIPSNPKNILKQTDKKKQRHYFADKGPSGQSHGFSGSHVWV